MVTLLLPLWGLFRPVTWVTLAWTLFYRAGPDVDSGDAAVPEAHVVASVFAEPRLQGDRKTVQAPFKPPFKPLVRLKVFPYRKTVSSAVFGAR